MISKDSILPMKIKTTMAITAKVTYNGHLTCTTMHVKSGSSMTTDAPIDNNGLGRTFSPTDLTAVSLATCIITVMGIAANQRSIVYDNISAEVTKIMTSNPRRIQRLEVALTIGHEWTDKERKVLEKVGIECPVALSLHPDIEQVITFRYAV